MVRTELLSRDKFEACGEALRTMFEACGLRPKADSGGLQSLFGIFDYLLFVLYFLSDPSVNPGGIAR